MLLFSYHSLLLEIDPNSRYESGIEGAVRILIEKACFADARVPERQELHQIVVIHSVVNVSVEDPAMVPEEVVNEESNKWSSRKTNDCCCQTSRLSSPTSTIEGARRSTWTPVANVVYVCHFRKICAPVDAARRRTMSRTRQSSSKNRSLVCPSSCLQSNLTRVKSAHPRNKRNQTTPQSRPWSDVRDGKRQTGRRRKQWRCRRIAHNVGFTISHCNTDVR